MLRALPAGLPACRQYINFKMMPKPKGGFDKIPIDQHGNDLQWGDPAKWMDAETAWNSPFNTHGIGFVATPGWLVVDLDKCLIDGAWTPLAVELANAFGGAYGDITPSGQGLRFICRGTLPDGHRCRFDGGEVYTLQRFVTITGAGARGNAAWDASHLTGWLMDRLKLHADPLPPLDDIDADVGRAAEHLTDDALIAKMLSQSISPAALMSGKPTMAQRWNMDAAALARGYAAEGRSDGLPYDHSSVDMAVMSDLAYWTGHDVERMQRLFQCWPGFRAWKYERASGYHMRRTIGRGLTNKTFWGARTVANVGTGSAVAVAAADHAPDVDAPAQPGQYLAFLPSNTFYHRVTGQFYPAASVDNVIPPIVLGVTTGGMDKPIKATKYIARTQPIHQATWFPGAPEIIENCVYRDGVLSQQPGNRVLNTYRAPPPPQPVGNDVSAWVNHLNFVYPAHAETVLDWMAHVAQKPDNKVNWALVWGGSQGIGKDSMLAPLARAVGEWNWRETTPETILTSQFNEYLVSRVLRINEAKDTGGESRFHFYDKTKTIIAAPPTVHSINAKGQRPMQVPNLNAVVITTNYRTGGLYLPADDRRHYVMFSDVTRAAFSDDYWAAYWAWMSAGGLENCYAFLMARDLSRFNPKSPPKQTPEFWEMVEGGHSSEISDLRDVIESMSGKDFTIDELAAKSFMDFNNHNLKEWLSDKKNGTRVNRSLEDIGCVKNRNSARKDGRWVINGRPRTVFRLP